MSDIDAEMSKAPESAELLAGPGLVDFITAEQDRADRTRRLVGGGMVLAAAGVTLTLLSGYASHLEITQTMPYLSQAQHVFNQVDKVLARVGIVAFPSTLAGVGIAKWRGGNNKGQEPKEPKLKLKYADDLSSRELNRDGNGSTPRSRRVLEKVFAGKIPLLAAIGVTLGSFSASVGNEVSNGPQRPIEQTLGKLIPGDNLVVQDKAAEPMLDGAISLQTAAGILVLMRNTPYHAALLTKYLGHISDGKKELNTLEFGTAVPANSPLYWNPENGCNDIPVRVDNASSISQGAHIQIDGVPAIVAETTTDASAIGRIGVFMDGEAMQQCIMKDQNSVYAVGTDAPLPVVEEMLSKANTSHESATVITKEQYLKNSLAFWEANVKPVTNTQALFSGAFSFIAMSASVISRLVRNRKELAAMTAMGITMKVTRASELLRGAKDSLIATIAGSIMSLGTPFIVNSLEPGFKAGIGISEFGVGAAVGFIGCMGGVLRGMRRPEKTIDVAMNTRVG